jgi:hypothetical protein
VTPSRARAWGIGALVLGLSACSLEPDVGPPLAGACSNADTDPELAISFRAQIRPLIARSIAGCSCHLPAAAGPGLGTQLSGLDLSSLSSLRAGGFNSGGQAVVASEPCASVLYQKVFEAPPFGSRMPLGGPPFWTAEELALLHDWIAEGAADN